MLRNNMLRLAVFAGTLTVPLLLAADAFARRSTWS